MHAHRGHLLACRPLLAIEKSQRKPKIALAGRRRVTVGGLKEKTLQHLADEDRGETLSPPTCRAVHPSAQETCRAAAACKASTELHGGGTGQQVCRDLAHLYHYYLHGEHGNLDAAQREARTLLQRPISPLSWQAQSPPTAAASEARSKC